MPLFRLFMCNKKTRSAVEAGPGSGLLALAEFIKRPQAEFKLAPRTETYLACLVTSTWWAKIRGPGLRFRECTHGWRNVTPDLLESPYSTPSGSSRIYPLLRSSNCNSPCTSPRTHRSATSPSLNVKSAAPAHSTIFPVGLNAKKSPRWVPEKRIRAKH